MPTKNATMGKVAPKQTSVGKENLKKQLLTPDKKTNKGKKVAVALTSVMLAAATLTIPAVVYYQQNKGFTVTIETVIENGAASEQTLTLKKGATLKDIQTPERAGYFFAGFYSDDMLTQKLDENTKLSKATTIYLHYVLINYIFQIPTEYNDYIEIQDLSGNKLDTTQALHHGDKFAVKVNLTTGYHLGTLNITGAQFTNEYTTANLPIYEIVADNKTADDKYITLTFEQQVNTYTVHFLDENGQELQTQKITHGELSTEIQYTKPDSNTKHYIFTGWTVVDSTGTPILEESGEPHIFDFNEEITADIYLKATFEEVDLYYDLTINAQTPINVKVMRNGEELPYGSQVKYGDELTISYELTEGHHLVEFKVNGKDYTSSHKITVKQDVVINFVEEINHYTVVFHDEKQADGSAAELGRVTVNHNQQASWDFPNKHADNTFVYEFANWATKDNLDATQILEHVKLAENNQILEVYANYNSIYQEYKLTIPDQVTVTYLFGTSNNKNKLNTGDTLHYDDHVKIIYNESDGYHMDKFNVIGAELVNGNEYIVNGAVTIEYHETINTYNMGDIPKGVKVTRKNGDVVNKLDEITHFEVLTVSYTLTEGYHCTEFTVAGQPIEQGQSSTTVTVTDTFNIVFTEEINVYTVEFYNEDKQQLLAKVENIKHNTLATTNNPTKERDDFRFIYSFEYWETEDGVNATEQLQHVKLANHGDTLKVYAKYKSSYFEYEVKMNLQDHIKVKYVSGTSNQYIPNQELHDGDTIHYGDTLSVEWISSEGYSPANCSVLWGKNDLTGYNISFGETFKFETDKSPEDEEDWKTYSQLSFNFAEDPNPVTINLQNFPRWVIITWIKSHMGHNGQEIRQDNSNQVFYDDVIKIKYNYDVELESFKINGVERVSEIDDENSLTITIKSDITSIEVDEQTDFKYTFLEETHSYQVDGLKNDVHPTEIIIPDYYNGVAVTDVATEAFENNTTITTLTIGENVTKIGRLAFGGINYLSKINFNAISCENLDWDSRTFNYAGQYSDNLTVEFGKNVTRIPAYLFNGQSPIDIFLTEAIINSDVISIEKYAFMYCKRLTNVVVGGEITSIGVEAFYHCDKLTTLDLSNCSQLTTIEQYAFSSCSSLTDIKLGSSVTELGKYAFGDCTQLVNADLSKCNQLTDIKEHTFYNCSSLKEITIPDNVATIGQYAFSGCTALTKINFNATIEDLVEGNNVFYNAGINGDGINVIFGENVTSIPAYLFFPKKSYPIGEGLPKIAKVDIGNNVTQIGKYSFYYTGITELTIPEGVTTIGEYAFSHCEEITQINFNATNCQDFIKDPKIFESSGNAEGVNVYFGKSVTKIPSYIFYNQAMITTVTLGENVTSIGEYAFYHCRSLTTINIPKTLETIGRYAFYYCTNLVSADLSKSNRLTTIGEYAFSDCSSLTEITILENVTSIGEHAFTTCTSLTKIIFCSNVEGSGLFNSAGKNGEGVTVIFGENVTKIPANFFSSVSKVANVTLGQNVTSIGEYAFYNCTSLTTINIPKTVETIGNHAFYGCNNLIKADISNCNNMTSIENHTFYNCKSLTEFIIPENITSIGEYAFSGCGVTEITIPENVATIGKYAFNCTYLTKINYNTNIAAITQDNYIFYNAGKNGDGITVTFGENVTQIPAYLFCPNTGYSEYNPKIVNVTIGDNITTIGESAFTQSKLVELTIGENVASIGNNAFSYCYYLTKINFNAINCELKSGANIFYSAGTNVESVDITIGQKVTKLPALLFYNCNHINQISLGANVKEIGTGAFPSGTYDIKFSGTLKDWAESDCYGSGLMERNNPEKYYRNLYIQGQKVEGNLVIPEGVKKIGKFAFYYFNNLTSITIPSTVTEIGSYAFANCEGVSKLYYNAENAVSDNNYSHIFSSYCVNSSGCELIIGDSVKKISKTVFGTDSAYYPNFTSITIGANINELEEYDIFRYYYHLVSVINKSQLKLSLGGTNNGYISYYAKEIINSVEESKIQVIDGVSYFVDGENYIALYLQDKTRTEITLDANTTEIYKYAFWHEQLQTVDMSRCSTLKIIGESAFYYCKGLTKINFPASLTTILGNAFSGCSSLKVIDLSQCSQLYTIDDYAFAHCTQLAEVSISGKTSSLAASSFSDCNKLKTVNIESSSIYKGITSDRAMGNLVYYFTSGSIARVKKSIIDEEDAHSTYLEDESLFTKSNGEGEWSEYYVFTRN